MAGKAIIRQSSARNVQPRDNANLEFLDDLENTVWEMQEQLLQLCDEVESIEPLQARQTLDNIKTRMRAVEDYIAAIQPEDTSNAT